MWPSSAVYTYFITWHFSVRRIRVFWKSKTSDTVTFTIKETGTGAWQKSSSDCKPCMKNVVHLLYRPVWHATQRKFILCWSLDLIWTPREMVVVEQLCIFLQSEVNWKCWNRWEDTEQISRCQTIWATVPCTCVTLSMCCSFWLEME